uniref:Protein kinase domain-containing protein n=1 Tax=Panagrellus redivivus TaxID=6233 RepID=A0A7E4W2K0_PANRE
MRSSSGEKAAKPAFNRILDDLARRQLLHDFQFGAARELYEARRNVGAGAFGIVCEAVDRSTEEPVAIKKIGHASATPTLARRTLREIRVLRYIRHENIIRLRDIFRIPGSLGINVYMVMDLMEGSLHHVIHGTNDYLEYDLVIFFLYQLLRGLKYLHAAGIAHRDLKPSNLLVNSDCHLRIADFGMAKLALNDRLENSEEHCFYMTQHVATLPYRAPELLFVMPEHSTAVDMWAVGCILAEMLLRREVFPGRSVSAQIKILVTQIGSPSQKLKDLICCDRTKRYIDNLGEHAGWSWDEIVPFEYCESRPEPNPDAVDLISKLIKMDSTERYDVLEALYHPFLKQFHSTRITEGACPFKVKMDMADVEHLTNEQLIDAVIADIRSAADEDYPASTPTNGPHKSFSERKRTTTPSDRTGPASSSLNSSLHSEVTSTDSRESSLSDHASNYVSYLNDRHRLDEKTQITAL